jgi:molybdopterin converting factor small subunit
MSTSTLAQLREIQQSIEEFKATLGAGVDDLEKKLGQSVKEVKKTLDVAVDDLASKLGPRWAELDGLLDRLVKALEESDDSKNPSETEDNEDHEAPVRGIDVRI